MKITEAKTGVCTGSFKAAGMKEGKYGVAMIACDRVCETAAVFTKSSLKGAHIAADERRLAAGMQAVIVNSGNANAYVKDGAKDAEKMCAIAARLLGLDKKHVGVASTGITGRRIDLGRIEELAEKVAPMLSRSAAGSMGAAKAIMTTDTVPKQLSYEYKGLRVGAIAKGSGMIAPNMATMLCFITTNADLPRSRLQDILEECVDASFNMMVVDGDTSPNDTVLLLSDRTQKCNPRNFRLLLAHLLEEMTKLLVKDGEGATKFLEVEVVGARTDAAAKDIAKTIVSSPLVKSALCGENPNWGRMIAAASRKEKIKLEKIDLTYESEAGRAQVVRKGAGLPLKKAEHVLKGREIKVRLNLNDGRCSATAWGCDLTEEYVRINAEYN